MGPPFEPSEGGNVWVGQLAGARHFFLANYPFDRSRLSAGPNRLPRCSQLEGDRRELQRVLPLRPNPPRALRIGPCVQAGGRWCPRLGERNRASGGSVDVHRHRDHDPPTISRLVTRGEGTPQGPADLSKPNAESSADHVAVFTLWPDAPDSTTVVCDFLFHRDEISKRGFDPADAVDFWDLVNRQDWQACRLVQRGMTSRRFTTGFYAPMEDWSKDIRRYIGEQLE